jgi:RNase P subunit RPR2
MNRDEALRLLQALRTGDKKFIAEYMRVKALEARIVCRHCGESVIPLVRGYDMEELAVKVECSLCGKLNRLPMKAWQGVDPLQPPPAS